MANSPDADTDDDFSNLYEEYTGPIGSKAPIRTEKVKPNKRSSVGFDDEEEPRNINAVPTDFTSREAKVWEAKSKATERNWKKRKEGEMICKICGESGHFTQGCPLTLGASRKSQDFLERVPAREKYIKALFTDKVIQKIEQDIGCKIKMEEKFIIVSGKDRLILKKGVDVVHKVKEEGEKRGSSGSRMSRSKSPEQSSLRSRFARSDSERSLSGPHNASQHQPKFNRLDRAVEDRVRDDLQKMARGSPSARAYGNDGARGHSNSSRSPLRDPYIAGNSYNSIDGHNHSMGSYGTGGLDLERRGSSDFQFGCGPEQSVFQQTLVDLELEYKREATELGRACDQEEDQENYKHREAVREMRENYMKKLVVVSGTHRKQWDDFLQLNAQRRQQQAFQHSSATSFGRYKQPPPAYPDYDSPAGNAHHAGASMPMDSRGRFPISNNYYAPSRHHDAYGNFPHHQRREEYEKTDHHY